MRLAIEPRHLLFKIEIILRKFDVLIVGDFPPSTHTGISMVNALVRNILAKQGKSVYAIDESAWIHKGLKRVIHYVFGSHFQLIAFLLKSKSDYVYLNIPLSLAGQLRLLSTCFMVRTLSNHTKLIGHIHRGDIHDYAYRSLFNRLLLKVNLSFFNRVAVLSRKFEDDLLAVKGTKNTMVIPNTSLIEADSETVSKNYNRNFVCISNIIETKGLSDLVLAFSNPKLKDFRLRIVGNIYEPFFYQKLNEFTGDNVEFITHASRNDVTNILKESDCLILPSWNEGQPLVILEAMSLGIPVIASAVGDIPNMLGNDYPFFYQSRNINMLVEKIITFDRFDHKGELGARLHSLYHSRYSNDVFEQNVIKLFS